MLDTLTRGFSAKDFGDKAAAWWDKDSEFQALHKLNPLRLAFIEEQIALAGKSVLDVGCGGGLLAEGLCKRGAQVLAIDPSEDNIRVAQSHAQEQALAINYSCATLESLADSQHSFDIVTSSEVIEHIPDQQAFVNKLCQLCKKDGSIFFSTINKTASALIGAKLIGEYALKLLPKGAHDPRLFLRPSSLDQMLRNSDFALSNVQGISYNPLTEHFSRSRDVSINYFAMAKKVNNR